MRRLRAVSISCFSPPFSSLHRIQAANSASSTFFVSRQSLHINKSPKRPCRSSRSSMVHIAGKASKKEPPGTSTSTLICTSLTAMSVRGQIEEMIVAKSAGADLAEIRIDLLDSAERDKWKEILERRVLPVIVTNRASWEGGKGASDEVERLSMLVEAELHGAEYIDVELAASSTFFALRKSSPSRKTKLILSHHNIERSLSKEEVEAVQKRIAGAGADICKIAMMASSAKDNALVFETLRSSKMPTIFLAMGELGQVSRIAAPKYGAYLTFASVGKGRESALGQVDTETLTNFYRFREIGTVTPIYGIIGYPVGHSMSPALHNAAMTKAGINGSYVYLPVKDDVASFIRDMTKLGFAGFSVTMPGKLTAMEAMDDMDDVARRIGAMNTVVRQPDGTLKGYNTDWVAAISAIEDSLPSKSIEGLVVVCIGAGGAGRALAFGALERGAKKVLVVNRSKSKADVLVQALNNPRAFAMSLEEFISDSSLPCNVLMNTTSVGMHPFVDDTVIPKSRLGCRPLVFDAVYNPLETKLLREAREKGCVAVSGLEMFVGQAAEQFKLWHPGAVPPVHTMREVVLSNLRKTS